MAIKFVSKAKTGKTSDNEVDNEVMEFPLHKAKYADTVPLKNAYAMYQPVKGTNQTSRYFMTGRAGAIRMATRFKDGKVSVRFESSKGLNMLKSVKSKAIGLTTLSTHVSVHMSAGDFEAALRVVGAVMLEVGLSWDTPIPNKMALKTVWGVS